MALQATVYRFPVQLSHVDRGVYEALDVRMARHPSETERYLLARLVAWCLLVGGDDAKDQLVEWSKGGLSSPDDPAITVRSLDGRLLCWVEIGNPSAERLHKASKASPRVLVVTHHDPALLVKEIEGKKVHKLEDIEVIALDPAFLDEVAGHIGDRGAPMEITISEGELYLTVAGHSLQTSLRRVSLGGDA
jgi:uncharacterized protein YaeQ